MWLVIALLIALGLILVIIEVVFIPGTTVVGVLGVILTIAGVIFGYTSFGSTIGFLILVSTSVALGLLFYYSFRSSSWDKFALKTSIDSKNNEGFLESFSVGEEGTCLSTLRPIGKAEFNKRVVEVASEDGGYVEAGTRVQIKEVSASGIIVTQIS
jgi:membrane-bound ClpP family serine protease